MTELQDKVLKIVRQIPVGKVATYAQIARALGRPRAARAVGNALHNNPYPIIVPCHRVVRSDGGLGGYAAGTEKKKQLLLKEGVRTKKDKIDLKRFNFSCRN